MIVYSRIDQSVLNGLFNIIPGLTEFTKLKDSEYSVLYDNYLSADYAYQKLNRFKTSSSRYDSVIVEKRIDLKRELLQKLSLVKQENIPYYDYFIAQLNKPASKSVVSKEKVSLE